MTLTKKQLKVVDALWELQRPASRDALMSQTGVFVSSRAMESLEKAKLVVRHQVHVPTLFSLTPAGVTMAQERVEARRVQ